MKNKTLVNIVSVIVILYALFTIGVNVYSGIQYNNMPIDITFDGVRYLKTPTAVFALSKNVSSYGELVEIVYKPLNVLNLILDIIVIVIATLAIKKNNRVG